MIGWSVAHSRYNWVLPDVYVGVSCQLERIGFFVVDKDTTPDLLVLNRTVTLREASSKTPAAPGKSRKDVQARCFGSL